MKKIFRFSLLLLPLFTLSSCIDIQEDIWVNSDGSGKYTIALDADNIMQVFDAVVPTNMLGLDKIIGKGEMISSDNFTQLKNTKGVSDVKFETPGKHVYRLSMNYADAEGLNNIQTIGNEDFSAPHQFEIKKKRLQRAGLDLSLSKPSYAKIKDYTDMPLVKQIYEKCTFTTTYHLPGKIKKVNKSEAKIDNSAKTVVIQYKLCDLVRGKTHNDIDIKFKKH